MNVSLRAIVRTKELNRKNSKKVYEGHGSFARTDDSSLSPKTNSARPAGCGIASLASQGRIIPGRPTSCDAGNIGSPSFLEGTVLNQRTDE